MKHYKGLNKVHINDIMKCSVLSPICKYEYLLKIIVSTIITIILTMVIKSIIFSILANRSRKMTPNHKFTNPNISNPNFVSSIVDEQDPHYVKPIFIRSDVSTAYILYSILRLFDKSNVLNHEVSRGREQYHIQVCQGKHEFHDDLKIRFLTPCDFFGLSECTRVDIISSSRVGYSDLGANRKRVELIKKKIFDKE